MVRRSPSSDPRQEEYYGPQIRDRRSVGRSHRTSLPAVARKTGGTADEAKAMLMKAVAAVRADEGKALDMFNKGEGGFRDRDLYVFCANASDGTIVAMGNPNLKPALGMDVRAAQ